MRPCIRTIELSLHNITQRSLRSPMSELNAAYGYRKMLETDDDAFVQEEHSDIRGKMRLTGELVMK